MPEVNNRRRQGNGELNVRKSLTLQGYMGLASVVTACSRGFKKSRIRGSRGTARLISRDEAPHVFGDTIPSYLTAWPSRDLIIASHQQITREWWGKRRNKFQLYISQLVVDEASAGDPVAARERLGVIESLSLLDITPEVAELAASILASGKIPRKAATDAAHVAIAAVHGMDFLLTWNSCTLRMRRSPRRLLPFAASMRVNARSSARRKNYWENR
jgi:hypothetical protein